MKHPVSHVFFRCIPAIIALSYIHLAHQPDLRLAFPALILDSGVILLALAFSLYAGARHNLSWSPTMILLFAAGIRLLFIFQSPQLSDDLFRYLWDGLQTLSGNNPYGMAPAEFSPAEEPLSSLAPLVNHPQFVTIYPPGAQLVFAAGTALGGTATGLKILLVALDLGCCYLIIRLLQAFDQPCRHAILYAWHPLPILEIAGSGHIDGAVLFFLALALVLLVPSGRRGIFTPRRRSAFAAGVALTWSILIKLFPLIFLPGILRLCPARFRKEFLMGGISGAALLTIPWLPELRGALATLGTYLEHWEFASFSYRSLRHITGSGIAARLILLALFATAWLAATVRQWQSKRPLTNLAGNSLKTFYGLTLLFLLCTPTLHPWYALYLVFFLPFCAGPAGLVLSWSVLLSYQVLLPYTLLGQWQENNATALMITAAPLLATLLAFLCSRKSSTQRAEHSATAQRFAADDP